MLLDRFHFVFFGSGGVFKTWHYQMGELLLYTTSGCHLCEHAERLLTEIRVRFQSIEIADDLDLLERYGEQIPVVTDAAGRELLWPFNQSMLQQFAGLSKI